MIKSRNKVAVSPSARQVGSGWVLDATFPNGNQAAIKGFRTESEALEWLGSIGHVMWLHDNPVGVGVRSGLAIFGHLHALAVFSASLSALVDLTKRTWRGVNGAGIKSRPACAAVASKLSDRASEAWASSRLPRANFWPRIVYRRGSKATGVLLILVIALAGLGRTERPAGSGAIKPQIGADSQIERSQPMEATELFDPIALLIDRLSSSFATAERPISSPVGQNDMQGEIEVTPPRHDLRAPDSSTVVGVWAPEPGSCSARNLRDGVLPTVISAHGARAGDTSCVFKNQRQTERDWRVVANCRNPHENWATNVRLTVKGDRLVWTSNRGTQAYTRCRPNA